MTALDGRGKAQQALRAGERHHDDLRCRRARTGGRHPRRPVAGVRGGSAIERQAYPVPGAPYGLAGSAKLAWIFQTASNVVVGYDFGYWYPRGKVRYPTVQQPDSLAYDEASNTLYVVSGSGAGVQVIRNAAGTG